MMHRKQDSDGWARLRFAYMDVGEEREQGAEASRSSVRYWPHHRNAGSWVPHCRHWPIGIGEWVVPRLLGVIDDRSRRLCHLQWYLHESK
ncbi:hypothetical protein JCM17961_14300 [Endothiovibrio diazotrophicus]